MKELRYLNKKYKLLALQIFLINIRKGRFVRKVTEDRSSDFLLVIKRSI